MTGPELGKVIAWAWRNGGLVIRVLGIADVRNFLDALKELGSGDPVDPTASLHSVLVEHGVDTKQLAEAIHPIGPQGSGNSDAFNAGSNNASI